MKISKKCKLKLYLEVEIGGEPLSWWPRTHRHSRVCVDHLRIVAPLDLLKTFFVIHMQPFRPGDKAVKAAF